MSFPIDHLHDPLRVEFVKIAKLYEVPDFVLNATEEQLTVPKEASSRAYAMPTRKALPLVNKVATWLSAAYLMENPTLPQNVKDAALRVLRGAANVYGIDLPTRKPEPEVQEPQAEDYLIDTELKSGRVRRLPVRNLQEAKMAVAYLKEHRHEFPWELRREASSRLLQKAASLQLELPEADQRMLNIDAANFVAPEDQLCELLTSRSRLAAHLGFPEEAESFQKLAKAVAGTNGMVVEGELAGDILDVVEAFDRQIGRKSASLDGVEVMTNDQFVAWADRMCVLKSGHVFDREDFRNLSVTDIVTATGLTTEQVADETGLWVETRKVAEAFEGLDIHKAQRAADLCERNGLKSNVKIARSLPTLSREDLLALAGQ